MRRRRALAALTLVRQGFKEAEIARWYGVSLSTVYRMVDRADAAARDYFAGLDAGRDA